MRHARFALLFGCVTGLVAGCANEPPAALSPAANAAALEARSLADPRLRQFIAAELGHGAPADGTPWGLARLTLAALYYHPDLDIARARLAAAGAAVETARQLPNPTLNLAAVLGTGGAALPAGAAPLTIGPVIDFVIETAGKRGYRTARATHLAAAARAEVTEAAWQVRGRVRAALADVWAAHGRLALLRRRLAVQDALVGLLETRLAAGAASAPDVARERIRRARLALSLRDGERALADARARLAAAVAVPAEALDRVALSFDAFDRATALPAPAALGALRRQALTGRSDVKAALARYAAAQSALQLAIAGRYPDVTLGPGYEYDFGVDKYLFGPSLMLPIFNQNEGPIAEAAAARREAAARFTALQAGIIAAIDRAAADYRAAGAALATADSLAGDAGRREEQVRRAFAAGAVDRPALLAAELEAAAARRSQFAASVEEVKARGSLEDALQQPLFGPAAAFPASADAAPAGAEAVR